MTVGCTAAVIGLRPQYPEVVGKEGDEFVEVDSLRPVLRWESFPTRQDREASGDEWIARIRNVAYDLKIYLAGGDYPAEAVYERRAIPEPFHRLEKPLRASTKYFWTVRARFELDGQTRLTQWGVVWPPRHPTRGGAHRLARIPSPFYFRFATPGQ